MDRDRALVSKDRPRCLMSWGINNTPRAASASTITNLLGLLPRKECGSSSPSIYPDYSDTRGKGQTLTLLLCQSQRQISLWPYLERSFSQREFRSPHLEVNVPLRNTTLRSAWLFSTSGTKEDFNVTYLTFSFAFFFL